MTGNSAQSEAAREALALWLQNVPTVRQRPARSKVVGEFDLHGLHYYMIAFKMSLFQNIWYIGVAGGYKDNELTHCGHVSSRLQTYEPETAENLCIEMVEVLRSYWMKRGSAEGTMNTAALFQASVLLKEKQWNRQEFLDRLHNDWDLRFTSHEQFPSESRAVVITEGCLAAAILVPAKAAETKLPESIRERNISHKAHLIVRVNAMEADQITAGKVFAWVTAALCTENTAGIAVGDAFYETDYYQSCARSAFTGGLFPVFNLIRVGIRENGTEYEGWTEGMRFFAKKEMEILHAPDRRVLRNRLYKAALYVITENAELKENETLRISSDCRMKVHIQEGVNVRDETIILTNEE